MGYRIGSHVWSERRVKHEEKGACSLEIDKHVPLNRGMGILPMRKTIHSDMGGMPLPG
jgi:hypothetical protein